MTHPIHIILDYGHGENCPGKYSPGGSFYEWQFTRQLGREIAARLRAMGYYVHETWTADHEPLSTPGRTCTAAELRAALNYRWKEVNRLCSVYGAGNCICISIHANAAGGDGQWHTASGFCAMVGLKASKASKRLARCIYDAAAARGLQGNRAVPPGHYWPQSLAMCDRTACPAVLTESMFYDNRADLALLQSPEGRARLVDAHIAGILTYLNTPAT